MTDNDTVDPAIWPLLLALLERCPPLPDDDHTDDPEPMI